MSEQQPTEQVRIRKKRYRKKKRWPKVLLWTLSIVVILGAGGLFAANYAIDKFLEQLASEIDLGDLTADAGDEQPVGSDTDPIGGGEVTEGTTQPGGGSAEDGNGEGADSGDSEAIVGGTEGDPGPGTVGGRDSTPAGGDASDEDLDGYSAEISLDKAQHVQNNVTIGDKSKVAAIILSQLSMEDIKRLQELASGGLTVEEKIEARALLLQKLTEEQYDEIIEVATKHGLSTGKGYQEQITRTQ